MNNKYNTKASKKNTSTKLISKEYAIVNENGEVSATTNREQAETLLKQGKQVYIITTYQMRIKHELKPIKD